jgi:hypothetical protein
LHDPVNLPSLGRPSLERRKVYRIMSMIERQLGRIEASQR